MSAKTVFFETVLVMFVFVLLRPSLAAGLCQVFMFCLCFLLLWCNNANYWFSNGCST